MRDPARIKRILTLLEQRWRENPDQRLGQLLCNLTGVSFEDRPFFLEDNFVEAGLRVGLPQEKS